VFGDGKMETVTLETIHKDLEFLKKELINLKEQMVDMDTVLTDEDIESLQEADKDFREGKTKKLN